MKITHKILAHISFLLALLSTSSNFDLWQCLRTAKKGIYKLNKVSGYQTRLLMFDVFNRNESKILNNFDFT